MLRLKSLGQALIEADDARVTPTAETVFATTLYLIVEAGRPIGREELTRLIWPGVSESRAQHGLRQVLYKLKTLGATIKADRSSLILSPRFCSTDFSELLEPQPDSVLEALAERIGGSFLPGYRPDLSEQFSTWVERQRDTVHSAIARTLVAGMQARKRVSDWTGAEQFASMCLSIDPLNEEATLTVAEAAALGGSKSKALSILNNYLKDIGEDASAIKLPAALLRRRISEAYQDNVFPVRDAPFVGREEEMAELTRALARAQAGNGSAYVITGEPGIGKTRLVSEFTRVAALQRVHIVRVGCQSHDVRRPLSAFVDLVPRLLALPGALGCSPESMGYLRRLVAHDPEEARNRDEMGQAAISYDGARKALIDILDAVSAEKCILLEIEDAQWLDPNSVQMLEEVSNWLASRCAFLMLTSRTATCARENISTLALRPLTGDASTVVARALASERIATQEDFVAWCVSSSGGNPYYLIELLRNGRREGNAFQASASLTRLLQNRVHMLRPDAKALLEACCILGRHSSMERITSCLEMPRIRTLRALDELQTSGMIELDAGRVLSRHDLLSTAVLTQLNGAVKGMLHRFAAAQLEEESNTSQEVGLIWDSAEHWVAAADAPRAILLLRRFGSYLMDVGMPEEAMRVLDRATGLASSPAEKYSIGTQLVRTLIRAERSAEAVHMIDKVILLRASISPTPSPLDELGVMSLEAKWSSGEAIPRLVEDCLEALSSASATAEERISTAGWLLTAADNLCDFSLGHRTYESVVDQVVSTGVATEARLWLQMVYNASFGDGDLARHLAEDLASHARRHCAPMVALRYLRHAAHVLRCYDSAERALSVANESFDVANRLSFSRGVALVAGTISSIYMQVGELQSATFWFARAVRAHKPERYSVLDTNMWSYRTELALRRGCIEEADMSLTACVHAADRAQTARSTIRLRSLQTQLAVLKGESICPSELDSLMAIYEVARSSSLQDFSVESLLLGLRHAGRRTDALAIADQYVSKYRRDLSAVSAPLAAVINSLVETPADGK